MLCAIQKRQKVSDNKETEKDRIAKAIAEAELMSAVII